MQNLRPEYIGDRKEVRGKNELRFFEKFKGQNLDINYTDYFCFLQG